MISPLKMFLYLLRNRITLNDKIVPVIKRPYPLDKTPCITIDDTNSKVVNQYHTHSNKHHLIIKRNVDIQINVWCNTEDVRHNLCEQINILINKILIDHYELCLNYNPSNQECSYLKETCKVLTTTTGRSVKGKCPKPKDYHYTNVWKYYDIERFSFEYYDPIDNDEYNLKPPLLHSIIKTNMNYITDYLIGGSELEDIKMDDDLL